MKKQIINCLKTHYGLNVTKCTLLSLGADVDACIYKVQISDRTTYFVKLKRGGHDVSVNIQLLLHNAGIKEVICPIKTLDGQSQVYINDFTLIVYPFIAGHDGFSQQLSDEQWIAFGKALKHIHQVQLPASMVEIIKSESYASVFRAQVRSIYERNQSGQAADEIALNCLKALAKHKSVILSLVDRAEKLADVIQKQSVNHVLCHGDIHAGNVLIANAGAVYIVDWDQPIIAPKERDLMFIGAGVGNVWNMQREAELFYTGYGTTEINIAIIDYYRCERIIQDVAEYYQELYLANGGLKDRLASYNHFLAIFAPNGVVDIALRAID